MDAVAAPLSLSPLDSHLFTLALGSAMFPWRYKPRDSHMARGVDLRHRIQDQCSCNTLTLRVWSKSAILLADFKVHFARFLKKNLSVAYGLE